MELSIVIVSWNCRGYLRKCLESLGRTAPLVGGMEVIVVDNSSSDGSDEMVHQEFGWVKLIRAENRGFAAGNNVGFRAARGRFLAALNPDTEVQPGAFITLLEYLVNHPETGIVAPKLVNGDGTVQRSVRRTPTIWTEFCRNFYLSHLFPQSLLLAGYFAPDWDYDSHGQADVASGACLVFSRGIFETTRGFDEQLFLYEEEVDLCMRVRRMGRPIVFLPQAVVTHYGGQSTRIIRYRAFTEMFRSRYYLFAKHYGTVAACLVRAMVGVHMGIRCLKWLPVALVADRRAEATQRIRAFMRAVTIK